MSPSDAAREVDTRIADVVARLAPLTGEDVAPPSDDAVRALVGAVLRVYEHACTAARHEIVPVDAGVSTTAAITLACALARSQSLTPFDLALWFSHTAPRGDTASADASASRVEGGPRE